MKKETENVFYLKYLENLQNKENGTLYKEVIYTNGIEDIELIFNPYADINFPNISNRQQLDLLAESDKR